MKQTEYISLCIAWSRALNIQTLINTHYTHTHTYANKQTVQAWISICRIISMHTNAHICIHTIMLSRSRKHTPAVSSGDAADARAEQALTASAGPVTRSDNGTLTRAGVKRAYIKPGSTRPSHSLIIFPPTTLTSDRSDSHNNTLSLITRQHREDTWDWLLCTWHRNRSAVKMML